MIISSSITYLSMILTYTGSVIYLKYLPGLLSQELPEEGYLQDITILYSLPCL